MDFSICDNMVGFPKYSHICTLTQTTQTLESMACTLQTYMHASTILFNLTNTLCLSRTCTQLEALSTVNLIIKSYTIYTEIFLMLNFHNVEIIP